MLLHTSHIDKIGGTMYIQQNPKATESFVQQWSDCQSSIQKFQDICNIVIKSQLSELPKPVKQCQFWRHFKAP